MPVLGGSFADRVFHWARTAMSYQGATDRAVRVDMTARNALQLLQSLGVTKEQIVKLVDEFYEQRAQTVWEGLGGTLLSLAFLAHNEGMEPEAAAEEALKRKWVDTAKPYTLNFATRDGPALAPVPRTELRPVIIDGKMYYQRSDGSLFDLSAPGGVKRVDWRGTGPQRVDAVATKHVPPPSPALD